MCAAKRSGESGTWVTGCLRVLYEWSASWVSLGIEQNRRRTRADLTKGGRVSEVKGQGEEGRKSGPPGTNKANILQRCRKLVKCVEKRERRRWREKIDGVLH